MAMLSGHRAAVQRAACERHLTESVAGSWVPGWHVALARGTFPPAPHLSLPASSKPICLPYFDEELVPGTALWVTGWGYTQEHGEWAPALCLSATRAEPPSSAHRRSQASGLAARPGLLGTPLSGRVSCR